MHPLLKKLNLKALEQPVYLSQDQSILIPILKDAIKDCNIVNEIKSVEFLIAIVLDADDIQTFLTKSKEHLSYDPILWFLYPKKSSKTYTSSIDRDHGWTALGKLGFEPVRQVAVDDDWSALRFRNIKYIKKMTRRESFTK